MMIAEQKVPAFPMLEPLTRATSTRLDPPHLSPGDFLEIDIIPDGSKFRVQCVGLRRVPKNTLPSAEGMVEMLTIQTDDGVFYKEPDRTGYPTRQAINFANKVPEKFSSRNYGSWEMAATDFTALVIHHSWPTQKIIWLSEEAFLTYCLLLKRFLVQTRAAEIVAKWKIDNEVPKMPEDFIEHPELPLSDYQKIAFLASRSQFSYALFMQQGTGKTPVVINRICYEGSRKMKGNLPGRKQGMYRALVVCPRQVRANWEREFFRFATSPGKVGSLRGGKLSCIKELMDAVRSEEGCDWSASIISLDSVNGMWESLSKIKWDLVVIDESHKIKNRNTRRFKTMVQFTERHTYAKMILTGTPIANTLFDLWAQLEWLGPGLSGFRTYNAFRSFHGKWVRRRGSNDMHLEAYRAVPLLQERLARLSFLITKKEAGLKLPDKVYDIYEVSMTPKQRDIYKQVAIMLRAEINDLLEKSTNATLTVTNVLTKLLRLAQICSGFITTDEQIDLDTLQISGKEIHQINKVNPKVEAVLEMLEEDRLNDPNSKAIVWACFIEDLRAISQRLHENGINHVGYHSAIHPEHRVRDTAEAETRINKDPNCRVIIANPASAGVGQNFLGYDFENPEKYDTYVDHEIYYSCNWNAVDRSQSEDRAHRRGTRTNVRITDLVVLGTVDEEIRDRVKGKQQAAANVQDIRNILDRIVGGYD
jgi:SNF2 family DNA or RNA helicase